MVNDPLPLSELSALSPLDGRYGLKTAELRPYFSEFGLIRARVRVEVEWLIHLASEPDIKEIPPFGESETGFLRNIADGFSTEDAQEVKEIESATNHDVKAVEYFLRRRTAGEPAIAAVAEFIHFACTSEDINNLSHALMLKDARDRVLLPRMRELVVRLEKMSRMFANVTRLSRTHRRPPSLITVSKELANVVHLLSQAMYRVAKVRLLGKMNGAVGNYNAHLAAYPDLHWTDISCRFVESLGLVNNPLTTQIEPHDHIAELCHAQSRFNTILLDLDRNFWDYISLGYFSQKVVAKEVGSSTMPHKVNPIDFENSEGNLGLANAVLKHLAEKLPVSRWQRDLTDSTVQRNLGVGMAYTLLAVKSTLRGIAKLEIYPAKFEENLDRSQWMLVKPNRTVTCRYSIKEYQQKLKAITRMREDISHETLRSYIDVLNIPKSAKDKLWYFNQRIFCEANTTLAEFLKFSYISDDINYLPYTLIWKDDVLLPCIKDLEDRLSTMAQNLAKVPMLSRTHGQPASPTTMGKELANVVYRLRQAKLQIELQNHVAEFCLAQSRFNTVLLDFNRDIWGYISLGYFRQNVVSGEVEFSTMPHKANPINFENSEGNLRLANAVLGHLAEILPVSRWQRDLTDSTVLRNLDIGMGYTLLAVKSALRGLDKLEINHARLEEDLDRNWEVLAEPIQTVMRRYGVEESYEKLKALTRGVEGITRETLRAFIDGLEIPESAKNELREMTPATYFGNADIATLENM